MHSFTLALLLSQTNDLGGQQLCCSGYNSGHTVISLSSSSSLGSPLTPTLWPQLKVPSIHDQTYSSCESQGRGWDNQQCLQRSVAWRKSTATLFRPTRQPQTTSWGTLHKTAQNLLGCQKSDSAKGNGGSLVPTASLHRFLHVLHHRVPTPCRSRPHWSWIWSSQ